MYIHIHGCEKDHFSVKIGETEIKSDPENGTRYKVTIKSQYKGLTGIPILVERSQQLFFVPYTPSSEKVQIFQFDNFYVEVTKNELESKAIINKGGRLMSIVQTTDSHFMINDANSLLNNDYDPDQQHSDTDGQLSMYEGEEEHIGLMKYPSGKAKNMFLQAIFECANPYKAQIASPIVLYQVVENAGNEAEKKTTWYRFEESQMKEQEKETETKLKLAIVSTTPQEKYLVTDDQNKPLQFIGKASNTRNDGMRIQVALAQTTRLKVTNIENSSDSQLITFTLPRSSLPEVYKVSKVFFGFNQA